MTKRFAQTFQVKTVFINEQTGQEQVSQKISSGQSPAGSAKVNNNHGQAHHNKPKVSDEEIRQAAINEVMANANQKGEILTTVQIQQRANEISNFIKPTTCFIRHFFTQPAFKLNGLAQLPHFKPARWGRPLFSYRSY
jgi:hypothetical protein